MRAITGSVLALLLLLTAAVHATKAQEDQAATTAGRPELVAVKFHADWCASCRRMGPRFQDLKTVAEEEPVLFARLDLTDRSSRKQAGYLMSMLGMQEVWRAAGAGQQTGFILLVDVPSAQIVGRLTADQGLKEMKAALTKALGERQG